MCSVQSWEFGAKAWRFMLAMTKCAKGFWKILAVRQRLVKMVTRIFDYFCRRGKVLEKICKKCEMVAKWSSGECIGPKNPNLWFNFAGEQRANRRHWCLPMLCHTQQWPSSSVIWRIEARRYHSTVSEKLQIFSDSKIFKNWRNQQNFGNLML